MSSDGDQSPCKGQTVAALRYERALKSSSKLDANRSGNVCATTSLFHQSAGKFGPLASSSFSSSDNSEGASYGISVSERRSGLPLMSSGGARHKGSRFITHSSATPSMAQLRARKIMSEAQKTKTCRSHCLPISPTSEGSYWEETSTDTSSNVDLETVAHVSQFIDSLQKKSQVELTETLSRPSSPTQAGIFHTISPTTGPQSRVRTDFTTHDQSSLINARDAVASSLTERNFTPISELTPRRANFMTVTTTSNILHQKSFAENSLSAQERIEPFPVEISCPITSSHPLISSHSKVLETTSTKSDGDQDSQNTRKDIHYYAILAQVQKVVQSDNSSMSLGKILADANKRGMSLNLVTEIYKQERFKTSCSALCNYDGDDNWKSSRGSMNVDKICEPCRRPKGPSSSAKEDQDKNIHCGNAVIQKYNDRKTFSGEVAGDITKHFRLCDQAVALSENSMNKVTHLSDASVVETRSRPMDQGNFKAAVGADDPSGSFRGKFPVLNQVSLNVGGCQHPANRSTYDQLIDEAVPKIEAEVGLPDVLANSVLKEGECPSLIDDIACNRELAMGDISPENERLNPSDGVQKMQGLNKFQLCQLKHLVKKAEELREADLLPKGCVDNATKKSSDGISESPSPPIRKRRTSTAFGHAENVQDIDAFLSRFSIQKDGESVVEGGREAGEDKKCGSAKSQGQGRAEKSIIISGGADSDCRDEVFFVEDVELVDEALEPTEEIRSEFKEKYQPGEKNVDLPEHLVFWRRNHTACNEGSICVNTDPTDGIAAVGIFSRRNFGGKPRQCFLSLDKRLRCHTGYVNIDFYSLYEATVVQAEDEEIDEAPWEYRDVGQRFLHEKSLESRNWFGELLGCLVRIGCD